MHYRRTPSPPSRCPLSPQLNLGEPALPLVTAVNIVFDPGLPWEDVEQSADLMSARGAARRTPSEAAGFFVVRWAELNGNTIRSGRVLGVPDMVQTSPSRDSLDDPPLANHGEFSQPQWNILTRVPD